MDTPSVTSQRAGPTDVLNAKRGTTADSAVNSLARLVYDARQKSPHAWNELVELCHAYLLAVARREMPRSLQEAFNAADFVQHTLATFIRRALTFLEACGTILAQSLGGISRPEGR